MNRHRRLLLIAGLLWLSLLLPAGLLLAQDPPPTPDDTIPIPLVHIVSEGENLTFIADSYGVAVDDIIAVNSLTSADALFVGQELIIPGGTGEAIATVYTVQGGDTLTTIAAEFSTAATAVADANRLINPYQSLPIGQRLTVVSRTGSATPQPLSGTAHAVAPGDTLLSIAARYNLAPTDIMQANDLSYPVRLLPGQRLRLSGDGRYRALPGPWTDIIVRPLPFTPGDTVSIYVDSVAESVPTGELAGQTLRFFPYEEGYAALVGLDAFTPPGNYLLTLSTADERPSTTFSQILTVDAAGYGVQQINVGEELAPLLAPEIRASEDEFLATYYTNSMPEKLWDGIFQVPVTDTFVTAPYGDGRSYNGGPIEIFHSGVDFGGTIGTSIVAPADGVAVFSDNLELRGLTVILDHGQGVMTAYFHLSESLVTVGEQVSAGQPIAAGGNSGLSTGPHLHWEFRVNNVAVDGLRWTTTRYP